MSSPSESSSSDRSTPPESALKVNEGSQTGLTLQQFVEQIETVKVKEIEMIHAIFGRRAYRMPVRLTVPEVPLYDRFSLHGHEKVEDVVYHLAGRTRLSTHGLIPFQVTFLGDIVRSDVFYYF